MRIGLGGIFHESNTFVPRRTTLADYEAARLYTGDELIAPLEGTDTEIAGFLAGAAEAGFEPVPTFYAWAWPSGPLTVECFGALIQRLKSAIEASGPLDGLLLTLHGAMVTGSEEDPDGVILAEARSCLGPGAPLVATFDLHANLSPLMVTSCDALIGYNTYPHVDLYDCGVEAARLIARMLRDEIQPVTALAKPPLMPHIVRQRTADGPMAELMAMARAAEARPAVLRVSIAAGFAYADVPRVGMGVLAATDGDPELAAETAAEIAGAAWERRSAFDARLPGAAEAVRRAVNAHRGPVVLADLADNVGGGSPGDGTEILQELLRQLPDTLPNGPALVLLADPEAVAEAISAGVRAKTRLRVGGKADTLHGSPVEITGHVRLIADGIYRNRGPMRDGLVEDQGPTAVLDCGPLTLVLTSCKLPMWNLEQLRCLGIDPARLGIIVVKGAVAHRAAYEPLAAEMIEVETAGACAGDIRRFQYRHVRRPLYPLDEW